MILVTEARDDDSLEQWREMVVIWIRDFLM